MTASTLGVPQPTETLNQVLAFLPRIVVALAILLVGALVGKLLADVVRGSVATGRMLKGEIQPGMQIGVDTGSGQIEGGTVEAVGVVYTTVRTQSGQSKIPNAELARKTVMVAGGQSNGVQPTAPSRRPTSPAPAGGDD